MSMQMFLSNGLQIVKLSIKGSSNDNKKSISYSLKWHFCFKDIKRKMSM